MYPTYMIDIMSYSEDYAGYTIEWRYGFNMHVSEYVEGEIRNIHESMNNVVVF